MTIVACRYTLTLKQVEWEHTHTHTNKMTTVNPRACVLRVNYRLVVTGITIRPQHLRPRVKGRSCVTAHVILFLSSDLLERGSCRRFLTSTGMASRRGRYGVRDLLPTPTCHGRTRSSVRGGDPGSNYGSGLPGYADGGRSRRPSASSGSHGSERNGSGSRGRGRRQGRGERGGEQLVKYKISTITNWELESLFNCRYSYLPTLMVDSPPTSSSRELREKLMEAPENTLRWEQVRELYKGLFSDGTPTKPTPQIGTSPSFHSSDKRGESAHVFKRCREGLSLQAFVFDSC